MDRRESLDFGKKMDDWKRKSDNRTVGNKSECKRK